MFPLLHGDDDHGRVCAVRAEWEAVSDTQGRVLCIMNVVSYDQHLPHGDGHGHGYDRDS